MDAVAALYAQDNRKLALDILASLSHAIFDGPGVQPANPVKRALARVSHRVLSWTTRTHEFTDDNGAAVTAYRNRVLERSGHPYAKALLTSSSRELAALVEGGDPMNGPYMMLSPEIRKNCGVWDRLFFDSVQGRDVQARILWETRATHEAAKKRLAAGGSVRLKAVAAGTGLSMMLVYDRLIRDGFDPAKITARITDRDPGNVAKAQRLLETLASARDPKLGFEWKDGIVAAVEDALDAPTADPGHDIITAIGILEYFQGHTYLTTEHRLKLDHRDEPATAHDLVRSLAAMSTEGANLIVNTYRDDHSTRILELFGKRFDYRDKENLRRLLETVDFQPLHVVGSGHIYDVKVYAKGGGARI